MLVHYFDTVAGYLSKVSANHLLVLFFSIRTTFNLFQNLKIEFDAKLLIFSLIFTFVFDFPKKRHANRLEFETIILCNIGFKHKTMQKREAYISKTSSYK